MTPTISDIINGYARALEARGCKASTINTRRYQLARVLRRLADAGLCTDPALMGDAEVKAVAYDTAVKESTARMYHGLLLDLCALAGNDAPRRVRILWNRTEPTVCWITAADLRHLMTMATPTERIVLVLGAMAGLRAEEMATLSVDDLHRDAITVRGKGHGNGLEVDQPIPAEVRAEIDTYLRWRASVRPATDRLVVWPRGYTEDSDHARIILYHHLADLGRRAGIKVTPHSLRRLYATTLADAGVDITVISRLMRHASIATTQRYIRRDRRREYEAVGVLASAYS